MNKFSSFFLLSGITLNLISAAAMHETISQHTASIQCARISADGSGTLELKDLDPAETRNISIVARVRTTLLGSVFLLPDMRLIHIKNPDITITEVFNSAVLKVVKIKHPATKETYVVFIQNKATHLLSTLSADTIVTEFRTAEKTDVSAFFKECFPVMDTPSLETKGYIIPHNDSAANLEDYFTTPNGTLIRFEDITTYRKRIGEAV